MTEGTIKDAGLQSNGISDTSKASESVIESQNKDSESNIKSGLDKAIETKNKSYPPQMEDIKESLRGLIVSSGNEKIEESLRMVLDRVLSDRISTPAREGIARCFSLVLSGKTWGDALDKSGVQWAYLSAISGRNKPFNELLHAVELTGLEAIKRKREQAAHRRAVDGWEEPVYGREGQIGTIRRYSDRLLETLLKGDDPARFNPQSQAGQQSSGSGGPLAIQINVHLPQSGNASQVTPSTITIENKP